MIAIVILSLVLYCSSASAQFVVIGDSQPSIRPPLAESDTFCYKMAAAVGKTCLNKAVGGRTSADVLANLSADVLTQSGTCVLIMVGANDAFIDPNGVYDYSTYWAAPQPSAVPLPAYINNMFAIVQGIKNAGKQVTLFTPWAMFSTPELIQQTFYADAVKYVGGAAGVPVLDADAIQRNLWWASKPWLATNSAPSLWDQENDYQHPSAIGMTSIASLCQKPQNANACACRP